MAGTTETGEMAEDETGETGETEETAGTAGTVGTARTARTAETAETAETEEGLPDAAATVALAVAATVAEIETKGAIKTTNATRAYQVPPLRWPCLLTRPMHPLHPCRCRWLLLLSCSPWNR